MVLGDSASATRHAVILAAGESKRTRPLTLHRPKPLIPLAGRPLLAHILDELVGLVERVTLVVGYRADQIAAAFGASYRGMELRYTRQEEVNGTAGALLAAAPIDEPFFLLYGDNLVAREDLLGVSRSRYGVAGLRVEDARSFGILELAGGQVRGIIEKPPAPPPDALANPGIYRFDAEVFPLLAQIAPSPRGELELTDLIAALAACHPVLPHVCVGHWVPVGTPWEALSAAQFVLARRRGAVAQIDPAAEIHPHAELEGPVAIGRARVEAGARIVGPAVIGDGCVVGRETLVMRSALEVGAKVGEGAELSDCVLGAGALVGAGARLSSSWLDDGAQVGAGAVLAARIFDELRPTAAVRGLLSREALVTRGAVLGRGAEVGARAAVEPGTIMSP